MGRIKDQIIKGEGAELGSLFLWKNKKEDIKQKRIFICGSADYFLLRPGTPNIPPHTPFSFCSSARRDFVALIITINVLSCLFASPQNQRAACEPRPSLESAHHFPFSHWSVPFCSVKAENAVLCAA